MIGLFLLLTICQGAVCVDRELPVQTMGECSVGAQAPIADFLSRHPGWRVKTWRCRMGAGEQVL